MARPHYLRAAYADARARALAAANQGDRTGALILRAEARRIRRALERPL